MECPQGRTCAHLRAAVLRFSVMEVREHALSPAIPTNSRQRKAPAEVLEEFRPGLSGFDALTPSSGTRATISVLKRSANQGDRGWKPKHGANYQQQESPKQHVFNRHAGPPPFP